MSFLRKFGFFLAPSLVQPVLSFLLVPLYTLVLGPAEYGAFALVSAFTGLGAAITGSGTTFMLSAHYSKASATERADLVSTLLWLSIAIGGFVVIAMGLAWSVAGTAWEPMKQVPGAGVALSLGAMLLGIPWTLAYLVAILDGHARAFAAVSVAAALVSAGVVLANLFLVARAETALFAGAFAGAITSALGAALVLRKQVRGRPRRRWVAGYVRLTLVSVPTNILEVVQSVVERVMLTTLGSLAGLGLYSHAQQYRNVAFSGVKAVSNAIWPTTLVEAAEPDARFPRTGTVWEVAHLALALSAAVFACFGSDLIAWLTHGKFAESGPMAAVLLAILLIQFSGKPQAGILYARNDGSFVAHLMGASALAGIGTLFVAVPAFGVWGAPLALGVQQALFRAGVQIRARRFGRSPFQDAMPVAGLAVFGIVFGLAALLEPGWLWRAALLAAAATVLLALGRSALRGAWSVVGTLIR